jgi:hypothetical protein
MKEFAERKCIFNSEKLFYDYFIHIVKMDQIKDFDIKTEIIRK